MHSPSCLCVCFLLFFVAFASASFDASRCKLIDQTPQGTFPSNVTNYLIRGSLPLDSNNNFAWDQMNSTFHQIVPDMPENYIMIDLSLLNKAEPFENENEKSFFRRNPNKGTYVNWPVWGNIMVPDFFSEDERTKMAIDLPNWQHDQLPEKIPELRELLYTNNNNVSTVIYVHCDAGMDRTGEISGSYYMRYLEWSFHKALFYDDYAIEDRNIHVASRNGLQWYCYYLADTNQMANNCSLPFFDNCGYLEDKCPFTRPNLPFNMLNTF